MAEQSDPESEQKRISDGEWAVPDPSEHLAPLHHRLQADGDRGPADLRHVAIDRDHVADLDRLDESHGRDRHGGDAALGDPGRQGAAGHVHLREHPTPENVAIAVHISRLRHGPDDRVAAAFGHQVSTGYG